MPHPWTTITREEALQFLQQEVGRWNAVNDRGREVEAQTSFVPVPARAFHAICRVALGMAAFDGEVGLQIPAVPASRMRQILVDGEPVRTPEGGTVDSLAERLERVLLATIDLVELRRSELLFSSSPHNADSMRKSVREAIRFALALEPERESAEPS